MSNPFTQTPKRSSSYLWQVFTGGALVVLLGLHFIANHFIAAGGIRDFAGVVEYLRNPVIVFLELAFLICVTIHALLGVRAIFLDLGLPDLAERRLTRLLQVAGILTVTYGLVIMGSVISR